MCEEEKGGRRRNRRIAEAEGHRGARTGKIRENSKIIVE